MAAQGRGDDTEIAHVARGELVVPRALQNREVLTAVARAAAAHNIPLGMLTVGNTRNSINPTTGAPEFGVMDWLGRVGDKVGREAKNLGLEGAIRAVDYLAKGRRYIDDDFEKEQPSSALMVLPPGVGNAPETMPSDSQLNYNQHNPGALRLFANNPIDAVRAGWHGLRAHQEARDRYAGGPAETTLHGGEGDAWRHARWNQRMVNAFGPEKAKLFADYNEQSAGSNPVGDRAMDLYNNQVGRTMVGDTTKAAIDELVRLGRLRTRSY